MIRDDVVADARMHSEWNVTAKGLREDARVLLRMFYFDAPAGNFVREHRLQQIRARGR